MWSALVVVVVGVVAGASAAPQRPVGPIGPPIGAPIGVQQVIPIISQDAVINPDGSYQYSYETANGIQAQEGGAVRNPGTPDEAIAVQGSFAYTADDGTPIQVQYVADENGFQPQGAHLPTPPPIPEAILRSLEYNAAHPEEDDSLVGQPQPGRVNLPRLLPQQLQQLQPTLQPILQSTLQPIPLQQRVLQPVPTPFGVRRVGKK